MAASLAWQQSLRQQNAGKAVGDENAGAAGAAGARNRGKLTRRVSLRDDVFMELTDKQAEMNPSNMAHAKRRRSTRASVASMASSRGGSVSSAVSVFKDGDNDDDDNYTSKNNVTQAHNNDDTRLVNELNPHRRKAPRKRSKRNSSTAAAAPFSIRAPLPLECPPSLAAPASSRPRLVSPVPLPPGVACIDPAGDGLFAYWPEFIAHCRQTEASWTVREEDILEGEADPARARQTRRRIMNWLVEVGHHFRVAQETLYHCVRLVDSTLALRQVEESKLQLVAVAAFLLSAKLEEYLPPTVESLVELTEHSYTKADVLNIEQKILSMHAFRVYGPEPMLFLNRYARAATEDAADDLDEALFKHACGLFVDAAVVAWPAFSEEKSSLVAAAAVCAARAVFFESEAPWTPTLEYYAGYAEAKVAGPAARMLEAALRAQMGLREGLVGSSVLSGLVKKYSSVSRHKAAIRGQQFTEKRLQRAQARLKMRAK